MWDHYANYVMLVLQYLDHLSLIIEPICKSTQNTNLKIELSALFDNPFSRIRRSKIETLCLFFYDTIHFIIFVSNVFCLGSFTIIIFYRYIYIVYI